jgi:spore coat protein CotF
MIMQLAAHEAYDLHELTLSCVNSITNMAYFIGHVKDQEFKAILERHLPLHIQDYNTKVQYLGRPEGPMGTLTTPDIKNNLGSYLQPPTSNFPPVTPRTSVQDFDDREIATAYLLTLKRAGREYAWAAMEAGNPGLRDFLEKAFLMSSHHAHEVWQWMVKKGYYPVEPVEQSALNTISGIYKEVTYSLSSRYQCL